MINLKGVCFGEVLWDNLPEGRALGGAPLNVCYHLNKMGVSANILTKVGNDQNGKDILEACEKLYIPVSLIQTDDQYPTSTVEVSVQPNKDVTYEIVFPVAWDFIDLDKNGVEAVKNSDFFVFGSLSSRHKETFDTLVELLKVAKYKVLDVNLREPFYTEDHIRTLMQYADFIKMNEVEIQIISAWLGLSDHLSDREKVDCIMREFECNEILVTYGAKGAVYHSYLGQFSYQFPAFRVEVKDTIGSGDSFLAAFLSKRLQVEHPNMEIEKILEHAATISGFVTQSAGACPSYSDADINRFAWLHQLYV